MSTHIHRIQIDHGKRAVMMTRVSHFSFTQKVLNAPREVFTSKKSDFMVN